MSAVAPHRNRLKGKHSAAPDDESVSYLASIFEENLHMQETHDCSELLFQFSFIELGEFEMVLDFVDSFRTISLLEAARIFWLQARRTLERLQNDRDDNMELAKQKMLQKHVNRCIQQYAFLSYGAQCGTQNLRKYLHNLILAPEYSRRILYEVMTKNVPSQRLKVLNERFQDSQLFEQVYRLKLYWITYDYLYEKVNREAKQRAQPLMRQVQNRIGVASMQFTRRLTLTLSEMRSSSVL